MDINKIDTSKFLYDPTDEKSYMQLKKIKEFKQNCGMTLYKVIPYIIYMYDPASEEIEQEFPYLPQRKMSVATMVGMVMGGGYVNPKIEEMLIGNNREVNMMVVKYLQLFNNPDIELLAAYKQIYSTLQQEAMGGAHNKNIIDSLETVNGAIKSLSERILRGKDETRLTAELYSTMEGRGLGIRVEDIAEKLKQGQDPFPEVNPYGKYKPKKLKFVGDK